jgi:uncharacterized protein (DUF1697 family)
LSRYVALLRGINVGGNKLLPMARLRALLEGLGYTGVGTLLQSGNVALTSRKKRPAQRWASESSRRSWKPSASRSR